MPHATRPLLLLVLLALLGAEARAQAPPRQITFEEAIRIALQESIPLRRTETAVRASSEAVDLARAAFLPDVTATLQPIRRYGLTFDQTTGALQQESSDALSGQVSTSVNLFSGFRDTAELRRRQLERQAGAFTLERAQEDVIFTVAAQFLQLLLDESLVGIRQEALAAQELQLERVRQLVEGGVRARADLLQQEALTAEAELAVLQAEGQRELAETQLVRTLQLDPLGDYEFVAPPLDAAEPPPAPFELAALTEAALTRRGDLRAQALQIAAAEQGVRVAASGYYPRINAFAALGSSFSSLSRRPVPGTGGFIPVTTASGEAILVDGQPFALPGTPTFEFVPFGDQFFGDNRSGNIGLSLTLPVFDRFLTRAQVRQARLQTENERLVMEDLRQAAAAEVRQALLDHRNAEARLAVTARQVAAAAAALEAEQDRYDLGVSTLAELALARSRLVEAESARAQAVAQALFQRRRIEYAAGLIDQTVPLFD
jgi:outer membrane protein